MAVGKDYLTKKVSEKTGLNAIDTKLIIASFLDAIKKELAEGKKIELRGFGRFFVKESKPRIARNPRNGLEVKVDKKFKPTFKVSDSIVNKLNEGQD